MEVIIISGLSGSGKSIALNALEDNGFFVLTIYPSHFCLAFLNILIMSIKIKLLLALTLEVSTLKNYLLLSKKFSLYQLKQSLFIWNHPQSP